MIIPRINSDRFRGIRLNNKPTHTRLREINIPKSVDANAVPRSIVYIVTGLLKSISNVFCLVSQGIITGVIDEDAKNAEIVISIGKVFINEYPAPIVKASHKNIGIKTPITIVGPLK